MDRVTIAYLLIAGLVAAGLAIILRLRHQSYKQTYARSQRREAAERR